MKKYDLSKIMKDAWRMMKQNNVGGVYQIPFSKALRFAWRKFDCVKKLVKSGKYDYIVKEMNLNNRFILVRKAFSALHKENRLMSDLHYYKGLMSKSEYNEYLSVKYAAEHEMLLSFRASCRNYEAPNYNWMNTLGELPEDC